MYSSLLRTTVAISAGCLLLAACGGSDQPADRNDTPAPDAAAAAAEPPSAAGPTGDAAPVASAGGVDGEALYARCVACHQTTGMGMPGAFPPLGGSEWVTGNPAVPIRILLHGLQGAITVAGTEYNGVMLPYGGTGEMTDEEVAAVLTYVRSSFGNSASAITAEQVAAERAATADRTTAYTPADLQPLLR